MSVLRSAATTDEKLVSSSSSSEGGDGGNNSGNIGSSGNHNSSGSVSGCNEDKKNWKNSDDNNGSKESQNGGGAAGSGSCNSGDNLRNETIKSNGTNNNIFQVSSLSHTYSSLLSVFHRYLLVSPDPLSSGNVSSQFKILGKKRKCFGSIIFTFRLRVGCLIEG